MKGYFKRIVGILLTLCLVLQPVSYVQAEEDNKVNEKVDITQTLTTSYVNPMYGDIISEDDLIDIPDNIPAMYAVTEYEADTTVLAAQLREAIVERMETVTIYVLSENVFETNEEFGAYLKSIVMDAFAETDKPYEGDYMRSQYGGYKSSASVEYVDEGVGYAITITFTHYTTAEQESEVDTRLQMVLWETLNLDDDTLSDYEKTKLIYDYICENVVYDYDNLEDDAYTLKYTAYAALMNGTSVCNGYAALMYRMMEEAGVDTRMVTGIGNGGPHAWNISKLGNKYYYSDATWDAPRKEIGYVYEYFLRGSETFPDHTPDAEAPVYAEPYQRMLSATTYILGDDSAECKEHISDNQPVIMKESTCVNAGYTICHCLNCNVELENTKEYLPLADHVSDGKAIIGKEATCTEKGYTICHCSGCKSVLQETKEELPIKNHEWDVGKVTKAATCREKGVKTYTCRICKGTKTESISVNKDAHKYNSKWTIAKATATKDGSKYTTCTLCGTQKKSATYYKASSVKLSTTEYTYNGKSKKPSVTVKTSKGTKLKEGTDYTVKYASGRKNVGKYKVTITLKGNYSGTITKYFKINPKKTSILKLTKAKKAFTVKWKKQSGKMSKSRITGYQIQYSTSKKFTSAKTKTVKKYSSTSKKITGLKAKKTYYVRVRTYMTVDGTKYYSDWSGSKKVKTK